MLFHTVPVPSFGSNGNASVFHVLTDEHSRPSYFAPAGEASDVLQNDRDWRSGLWRVDSE